MISITHFILFFAILQCSFRVKQGTNNEFFVALNSLAVFPTSALLNGFSNGSNTILTNVAVTT
jgi:hypothetical protein